MNAKRRKSLSKLADKIEELKAELSLLIEEEQEYFDNMPESFQVAEKGENTESVIETLTSAFTNLEEAYDSIIESTE